MVYKINGMHCNACKTLIEMQLSSKNINGVQIDENASTMFIPPQLSEKENLIKAIINSMKTYSVEE